MTRNAHVGDCEHHLAREQARVDAKWQTQASASNHKRAMSEKWDGQPGRALRRVDEEDATMRHDITATSGASSGGPAMDIDSQPSRKRAADFQTEDLEYGKQTALTEVDANESTLSSPQAERESSDGRTFIGSWEHDVSEMHNQRWEDKVAGHECLGLGEIMDITTMDEQGVHWDFTNEEMRNEAYRRIVAEKPFFACWSAPMCKFEIEHKRGMKSNDTERERWWVAQGPGTHAVCLSHVQICSTRTAGIFCMNTVTVSCHGGKIASMKFRERQVPSWCPSIKVAANCRQSGVKGMWVWMRKTQRWWLVAQQVPSLWAEDTPSISTAVSTVDQNTRTLKTCARLFSAECSCSTNGANNTSIFWPLWTWRISTWVSATCKTVFLLEEWNDELLDQAWDDHTGASLDAKKVKEAVQLDMEYFHKMHVLDKVPCVQCWERTPSGY